MVAINPEVHCPHIGYSDNDNMCSDDYCYYPGDPDLIHVDADDEFKGILRERTAAISSKLALGLEYEFPDICSQTNVEETVSTDYFSEWDWE